MKSSALAYAQLARAFATVALSRRLLVLVFSGTARRSLSLAQQGERTRRGRPGASCRRRDGHDSVPTAHDRRYAPHPSGLNTKPPRPLALSARWDGISTPRRTEFSSGTNMVRLRAWLRTAAREGCQTLRSGVRDEGCGDGANACQRRGGANETAPSGDASPSEQRTRPAAAPSSRSRLRRALG